MSSLNAGQQNASDAFFTFLFSEGTGFIISGKAGVGKTYLMSHIIDKVIPQYEETCKLMGINPQFRTVNMTATTNKAAEVLASSTKRPTSTIHSFMNLKVSEDYATGKMNLSKKSTWQVHQNMILFVDECSMIDSKLFELINEGTHKCKIVYVGDRNQMAPVTETLSPVYKQDYPFFELTEPMRNNGQPALMDICAQLRETVETGIFKPIHTFPGVIDHVTDEQMEAEIATAFTEQNHEARILAYTNNRVLDYNAHIRKLRGLPTVFTEGEFLVCNSSVNVQRRQLSVEEEITIEHIKSDTEFREITEGVQLEVQLCSIYSEVNGHIDNVPIPVDKPYFDKLIKWYAGKKQFSTMFNLKQTYPDLRQRDAATVYKAQGSTYDTVFIDLSDISGCRNPDQAARLLYVACSRPKNRIVFYGSLAEKFGGTKPVGV